MIIKSQAAMRLVGIGSNFRTSPNGDLLAGLAKILPLLGPERCNCGESGDVPRLPFAEAMRRGWAADLLVFRGCGDEPNRAPRFYHSGDTADLAFARSNLDGAEAALQEAREVLEATQRERWIANTLAGLAEVALLRGDEEHASALLADARERYASRDDALGVADVEERLSVLLRSV